MLAINFNKTQDTNQRNAPNAGLIDFSISVWCKYSQIKAQANGQSIKPTGQANNHTTIHIIHHQFHHLDHQNFLVHNIGK